MKLRTPLLRLATLLPRQTLWARQRLAFAAGEAAYPATADPITVGEWNRLGEALAALAPGDRDFLAGLYLIDTLPVLAAAFFESSLAHGAAAGEKVLRLALPLLARWNVRSALGPAIRIHAPRGAAVPLPQLGDLRVKRSGAEVTLAWAVPTPIALWAAYRDDGRTLHFAPVEPGAREARLAPVGLAASPLGAPDGAEVWLTPRRPLAALDAVAGPAAGSLLVRLPDLRTRYETAARRLPDVDDAVVMSACLAAHAAARKLLTLGGTERAFDAVDAWVTDPSPESAARVPAAARRAGAFPEPFLGMADAGDAAAWTAGYETPRYQRYLRELAAEAAAARAETAKAAKRVPPPPPPQRHTPRHALHGQFARAATKKLPAQAALAAGRLTPENLPLVSLVAERELWIHDRAGAPTLTAHAGRKAAAVKLAKGAAPHFYFASFDSLPDAVTVVFAGGKKWKHRLK